MVDVICLQIQCYFDLSRGLQVFYIFHYKWGLGVVVSLGVVVRLKAYIYTMFPFCSDLFSVTVIL